MKFLTNLTLGKKITLLTTMGLLLGVAAFNGLSMRAVNQATETMLEDRLTTAQLVADYLDETLGRALEEVKSAAEGIGNNTSTENVALHAKILEDTYARLSINASSIYLIGQDGLVLWSKPRVKADYIDLSAYPSVLRTIVANQNGVSGLTAAPITNTPVILFSAPTQAGSPQSQTILVVAIDPVQSNIAGFIQPIRLGQSGYVEIVDQNGIVVARTEPGPKLAPFEKSDHSGRFAALISAGKPTRGVCHTCHVPEQKVDRKDVLAFAPLSQANWGVVIRQSESEALTPARQLRQNLFLLGLGLAVIALSFVVVTTRDIGKRITSLTGASHRIADGDLVTPITAAGKDEVGVLAQTLDDMRSRLKASYGALEQKTGELASLLSVSEIMTSTLDLPDLLDAVVAKAVEIIPGADGGVLLLQRPDKKGLVVQSALGLDRERLSELQSSTAGALSNGPITERTVMPFLYSDSLNCPPQHLIWTEVLHRNRPAGNLMIVSFAESRVFSESDRRLLQTVADHIAIAIERAQLTKETEEARALHEADRLRSQFISSVSHELRAPLTLIKGYSTSLLRLDVSWDEKTQREFLQIIDEKTDELRDLIDKLLQSAKLEAGALKLEKEPVLFPRIARKVIEELSPRARKHKLLLDFPPSFPVVEVDVRCMEQVVRNLVENAIKYSPEGGKILISGESKNNGITVSVRDEGVGVPPEHRDKIFERFYRINDPLTRNASGSGLGLSITKGHIEAHGGKIWLESTVGKGSTFSFFIPMEPVESLN